ncbi:nucleotide pyrophosphohydrolase [Chlamydiota bacterium]
MEPFRELLEEMNAFFEARDWGQFHSPKNIAINLAVESAEVLEHFRWLSEKESYALPAAALEQVGDEMGDVLINLVYLAQKLGIDPLEAARKKLLKNCQRYPVAACKGKNLKYTAYESSEGV